MRSRTVLLHIYDFNKCVRRAGDRHKPRPCRLLLRPCRRPAVDQDLPGTHPGEQPKSSRVTDLERKPVIPLIRGNDTACRDKLLQDADRTYVPCRQQQEDLRDKQQNLSPFLLCRLLRRIFFVLRVLRVLRYIAFCSTLCLCPLRRAARCRSPGLACGICLPWLSVRPCLRCGCLSPGLAALPYLAVRRSPGLS